MLRLVVGMGEVRAEHEHGHASVAKASDGIFGSKRGTKISIEMKSPISLGKKRSHPSPLPTNLRSVPVEGTKGDSGRENRVRGTEV